MLCTYKFEYVLKNGCNYLAWFHDHALHWTIQAWNSFSVLFNEKMLQKYKFYEIVKFVISPRRPSYGLAMRQRNGFLHETVTLQGLVRLQFDYNSSKAEVIRKCSVPWLCRIFRVNIFKNKKKATKHSYKHIN